MRIREIEAKSILRKHKKIDSWFVSQYGLNPYRGCSHSCVYCDGRAEGYYTYGEFGEDIDILKEINAQSRAIVSMSFSSANEEIARIFEPGVPSREERLETLAYFKSEGITCGMFLLPVIPFSTDTPELIGGALGKAREAGVDFVIFGGMTLKDGRQKDHFINSLSEYYPELVEEYRSIYPGSRWGEAMAPYYDTLNRTFDRLTREYNLPRRIPHSLYADMLDENDLVIVMLEQMDYFLRMEGKDSLFGYAAYSISQLKQPLSSMKRELRTLKGVGETTERIILEILETGTSSYYRKLSG